MNTIAQKSFTSLLQSANERIARVFEVSQYDVEENRKYNQQVVDAAAELCDQVDSTRAKHLFYDV